MKLMATIALAQQDILVPTVLYLLMIVRMIATMMRMTVTPAIEPVHHSQWYGWIVVIGSTLH